ncbi:MAG: PASTA domain-containing protein, partial [Chloroflexota bacterium]|nr:PASTA domain-containing protein [Chloroflexota bacterium]
TVYMPRPVPPAAQVNVAAAPRYVEEERRGQPWWIWLLILLALALLAAAGFIGAQFFTGFGPGGSPPPSTPQFALPNWEGDPISAVRLDAERLGLTIDPAPREASDTIPADSVIRTDPEPGTPVVRGDTIRVVVSSGEETVEVPTLAGQRRDEARVTLANRGLELGAVTSEPSDQAEGIVLRSDPQPGVEVPVGSSVNIVLSSGPTPTPTPTPTPPPTPTPTPTPVPPVITPLPTV